MYACVHIIRISLKLSPLCIRKYQVFQIMTGFVSQFVCDGSSMDCWFSKCSNCSGITASKLKDMIDGTPLDSEVSYNVWKKSHQNKRIERQKETGTLSDLIAYTAAISPQFLRHSFVKREQAEMFNTHDLPRAKNIEFADEGFLQIDFAKLFLCKSR